MFDAFNYGELIAKYDNGMVSRWHKNKDCKPIGISIDHVYHNGIYTKANTGYVLVIEEQCVFSTNLFDDLLEYRPGDYLGIGHCMKSDNVWIPSRLLGSDEYFAQVVCMDAKNLQLEFSPVLLAAALGGSATTEAYGATCGDCHEYYEYAVKVNSFICKGCQLRREVFG
jgi:hypothetical protein